MRAKPCDHCSGVHYHEVWCRVPADVNRRRSHAAGIHHRNRNRASEKRQAIREQTA